ncbi:hypothetical protein ACOMHN_036297 [Nucella lapillus]
MVSVASPKHLRKVSVQEQGGYSVQETIKRDETLLQKPPLATASWWCLSSPCSCHGFLRHCLVVFEMAEERPQGWVTDLDRIVEYTVERYTH